MPQSSEEMRRKWGGQQGVGEDKATRFLMDRGWHQVGNGLWEPPTVTLNDFLDEGEQWEAFQFLVEEWDHSLSPEAAAAIRSRRQEA